MFTALFAAQQPSLPSMHYLLPPPHNLAYLYPRLFIFSPFNFLASLFPRSCIFSSLFSPFYFPAPSFPRPHILWRFLDFVFLTFKFSLPNFLLRTLRNFSVKSFFTLITSLAPSVSEVFTPCTSNPTHPQPTISPQDSVSV